ncbi:copper transporter [Lapillicoccus jejuensis]|uniref:Copper transport outer membrane protein MctB n=1 Tax=Lapillicoccus jejuensis TaxID=402171 RepID=A0A542E6L6_9MICO|nr:copper transporter [Lapillicoccus jejuensis]TQJ10971.1 copper transport outer membrane protein MctB [Lapillicoccus jejuensis]
MIDFRYHLVSIVSIFVALAVGIVLGAGPLQGSIGTQLSDQVSQLRQEKDQLRTELDDAGRSVTQGNDYAAAVAPTALAGRLKDVTVVLVVTSDTAGQFSEVTRTALEQAGATVTTVVTLSDAFRSPDSAAARLTAGAQASALLGTTSGDDGDAVVAQVLARTLVRGKDGAPAAPSGSVAALQVLTKAGLIDLSDDAPARAQYAVLLGGPLSGTKDSVAAQVATMSTLLTRLDADAEGALVATGSPSTAVGQDVTTSLVTSVRADKQEAATVTTVDHADSVTGAGLLVLAAAADLKGTTGHYGISSDAKSDVPSTS